MRETLELEFPLFTTMKAREEIQQSNCIFIVGITTPAALPPLTGVPLFGLAQDTRNFSRQGGGAKLLLLLLPFDSTLPVNPNPLVDRSPPPPVGEAVGDI